MNVRLLIEALVRQMTVLLAELATSGGLRAPLANVADRVFIELARELEAHGVSRTVSADMFGLALRTYLRRLRRYDESVTDRGTSLWEAVLRFLESGGVVTRAEVLSHFSKDEEALVRGVLQDLTDSALVFRSGMRDSAVYRVATTDEVGRAQRQSDDDATDNMIWALVRREGPISLSALLGRASVRDADLEAALARLEKDGRVERITEDGETRFLARSLVIPLGARSGWEGAVYDHFHAMVKTIIGKLRQDAEGAHADDRIGGSTYSFEVWEGHPLREEVLGQLAAMRAKTGALRRAVDDYNAARTRPRTCERVTVYLGQCLIIEEEMSDA